MTSGADSETGLLRDVLLGPPDNFRWLADQRDLEGDARERREVRPPSWRSPSTASWSPIYESAGVTVHLLEPDPALPYQVFARDSSVMTPDRARSSPSCSSPGAAASTRR